MSIGQKTNVISIDWVFRMIGEKWLHVASSHPQAPTPRFNPVHLYMDRICIVPLHSSFNAGIALVLHSAGVEQFPPKLAWRGNQSIAQKCIFI